MRARAAWARPVVTGRPRDAGVRRRCCDYHIAAGSSPPWPPGESARGLLWFPGKRLRHTWETP
jgi:hypothetical protein